MRLLKSIILLAMLTRTLSVASSADLPENISGRWLCQSPSMFVEIDANNVITFTSLFGLPVFAVPARDAMGALVFVRADVPEKETRGASPVRESSMGFSRKAHWVKGGPFPFEWNFKANVCRGRLAGETLVIERQSRVAKENREEWSFRHPTPEEDAEIAAKIQRMVAAAKEREELKIKRLLEATKDLTEEQLGKMTVGESIGRTLAMDPIYGSPPVREFRFNHVRGYKVDVLPIAIDQPEPAFPAGITRDGQKHEVKVEFLVDLLGNVQFAQGRGSDAEFVQAAENAVKRWKYKPAMMLNSLVEAVVETTIEFGPN